MLPQVGDTYLKMDGGYSVAWSLEVPSQYGDWSLVSILYPKKPRLQRLCDWQPRLVVVPFRPLTGEEVSRIKNRPLVVWGMKVPGQPWALVMCRPSKLSTPSDQIVSFQYDPFRAIGV